MHVRACDLIHTCLTGVSLSRALLAIFRHKSLNNKHVVLPVPLLPRMKAAEFECLTMSISSLEISNGNSVLSGSENRQSRTFTVIG